MTFFGLLSKKKKKKKNKSNNTESDEAISELGRQMAMAAGSNFG